MINKNSQTDQIGWSRGKLTFWVVPILIGLIVASPFLYASWRENSEVLIRFLTGDAYHYLAIGRNSHIYHMFTYDGLTVTNGFHPLWQYLIRTQFFLFDINTHSRQAVAVMFMSLFAITLGSVLTSAAIIRLTNQKYLGLLVAPGVFYLLIGVHANCLSIWSNFDGMESGLSVLFGGLFYFLVSKQINPSNGAFDLLKTSRIIGLTIPFIILSRLDDVFIIPAFLLVILIYKAGNQEKLTAALWLVMPAGLTIVVYLFYNFLTVGAAMPLSGSTKAGFVGPTTFYLTSAIHFPPIMDIKNFLTEKQSDGKLLFENRFRFIQMLYPLLASVFGVWILIERRLQDGIGFLAFGICLYILFKMGYNFLFVHPWHQAGWYYAFISLSLTVLAALTLNNIFSPVKFSKTGKIGLLTFYGLLLLFLSSVQYYELIYIRASAAELKFWEKKDLIRSKLLEKNVTGLINVDDGITAFLLDFPSMHGFAFATDVNAQKAYREGRMLTLALSRGINALTGFGYLPKLDNQSQFQANPLAYLKNSLAWDTMFAEADKFDFNLIYYDEDLKMPFILFRAKPIAGVNP
jgi:hypothetical protein